MTIGSGDAVWRADGTHTQLGERLAGGGAGSIFRLRDRPDRVAKIYHREVATTDYEQKVRAMLRLSPQLPAPPDSSRNIVQIAWPIDLLFDSQRRFVGFSMPMIDLAKTCELELILQERQARRFNLPVGLGARITLAANLAAAIAALHELGHHVVDLKPINLRFYRESLYIALLDCDGFSIAGENGKLGAPQFTPDYLAPEFHSAGIPPHAEEQQDRFALAVVIFQLLNFGIHPYTGRPGHERVPTDIPSRIAAKTYAYGLRGNALLLPSPVSGHQEIPTELRQLFDRAFDSMPSLRPSAKEWMLGLKPYALRASGRVKSCSLNREHQHFASLPCAACRRDVVISSTKKARKVQSARASEWRQRSVAGATRPRRGASPSPPPASQQPARSRHLPLPGTRPSTSSTVWPAIMHLLTMWDGLFAKVLFVALFVAVSALSDRDNPSTTVTRYSVPTRPAARTPPSQPKTPMFPDYRVEPIIQSLLGATYDDNDFARNRNFEELQRMTPFPKRTSGSKASASVVDAVSVLQSEQLTDQQRSALFDMYRNLLRKHPKAAEAAYQLGWLSLHAGQVKNAGEHFRYALWTDPYHARSWYGYALTQGEARATAALVLAHLAALRMPEANNRIHLIPDDLLQRSGWEPKRFRLLENDASTRVRLLQQRGQGIP